jgi:ABC-type transport system involved in multi-copper enzyme maturation permease subunit
LKVDGQTVSAGPLFHRDIITQPRHAQHYLLRVGYIFLFMLLLYTASQATFGWQQYRSIQARASFGALVFQLFSMVQLTLVIFLSLLYAANNIAQEKDRRTFDLLLLTDLRNYEIVFGKLLGSLLPIYTMIICSIPVFVGVYTLGGITLQQVISLLILCAVGGLAAGSWGTLVGLWRDKTFQTLAISLLGFMMLIAVTEGVAQFLPPLFSDLIGVLNPYRTLFKIVNPFSYGIGNATELQTQMLWGISGCLSLSVILCTISIVMLRVWNPVKTVYIQVEEDKNQLTLSYIFLHPSKYSSASIFRRR